MAQLPARRVGGVPTGSAKVGIGLQEAADRLGVHYMTVYRYIRTGRLAATMERGEWRIDEVAVDQLRPGPARRSRRARRRISRQRFEERLLSGDELGAWNMIEDALTAWAEPADIHLELLAPVLCSIGERWESGELDVADEHRASAVARRLIGRLGPRFSRRGRKRGLIVLGAPPDELHDLPVAMVADHLRAAGFEVVDLGGSTPVESFALAAQRHQPLAVMVGVTGSEHDRAVKRVAAAVRRESGVPLLVGGAAVPDANTAASLGGDLWTGRDARSVVAAVEDLISR